MTTERILEVVAICTGRGWIPLWVKRWLTPKYPRGPGTPGDISCSTEPTDAELAERESRLLLCTLLLDARAARLEAKIDKRQEQQRRRILEAGKHAASADHLEPMCRELLNVHGATTFYRVIDDLLLTFGTRGKGSHEHRALTANDLAAAEDPVSTLVAVAEEFSVEPTALSELMMRNLPMTRVEAELWGRDLLRAHSAEFIIRIIDGLLQKFAPHLGLTAKDLGATEEPVSTLAGVIEEYEVAARALSDLCCPRRAGE